MNISCMTTGPKCLHLFLISFLLVSPKALFIPFIAFMAYDEDLDLSFVWSFFVSHLHQRETLREWSPGRLLCSEWEPHPCDLAPHRAETQESLSMDSAAMTRVARKGVRPPAGGVRGLG